MRTAFIINPKSGKKLGCGNIKEKIKKYFPQAETVFTEFKGHARDLAKNFARDGFEAVIVAGGDGTINEAVQSLASTQTALGVIALGSGNGLARELGCPLSSLEERISALKKFEIRQFDLGRANGEYFINLAGLGMEADIAAKFDEIGAGGKRGKWPYFKIGVQSFFEYKAPLLKVEAEGKVFEFETMSLVFANGRQYGSNFKIAPKAAFDDGFLDMTVIRRASIFKLALGLPSFFLPSCKIVSIADTYKIRRAKVFLDGPFSYHIDGEPKKGKDCLEIEISPSAIKVLCAERKGRAI